MSPFRYDFHSAKPPLRGPSGKRVFRIAHAGASAYAPANSLRSLDLAVQLGADMVEFDVLSAADGLVLSHNNDVVTDQGPVVISASTLSQLSAMTIEGEHIATVDEALALLKDRVLINLDLKDEGHEREVAAAILKQKLADQVLVSSLSAGSLRRLREALPEITTGFSYPEDKANASSKPYMAPLVSVALWFMRRMLLVTLGRYLGQSGADNVMLYHKIITRSAVRALHSAGLHVFTWTVDDVERMRQLIALGVDGITTNRPDLFDQLA